MTIKVILGLPGIEAVTADFETVPLKGEIIIYRGPDDYVEVSDRYQVAWMIYRLNQLTNTYCPYLHLEPVILTYEVP